MTDPGVIILLLCEKFDCTEEELLKTGTKAPEKYYRQIGMRLMKLFTDLSLAQIAAQFNRIHHTTTMHALRKKKHNPFEYQYDNLSDILRGDPEEDKLFDAFVFTSL